MSGKLPPPRRVLGLVGLCLCVLLMVIACAQAGRFLVVSDEPARADATILTYSVNSFARPVARRTAFELAATRYHAGEGPHVLIGTFLGIGDGSAGEADERGALAERNLIKAGVPETAIEILPPVAGEYEEGQQLRRRLDGRGWRRVVVFAPDFRARRTSGTLKRALAPIGVEVLAVPLRDPDVNLDRWWMTQDGIRAVFHEYPRLAYYALLRRM